MRLKRQEIKEYRAKLLRKQQGICPLCSLKIEQEDATLDHNHTTGKVRRVLHRSCNTAEGKILSWCFRTKSNDPELLLSNLILYWRESYDDQPYHPAHLTEDQKLIKKYRRLLRKSKRERTKQKYRDLIKEVQDGRHT